MNQGPHNKDTYCFIKSDRLERLENIFVFFYYFLKKQKLTNIISLLLIETSLKQSLTSS